MCCLACGEWGTGPLCPGCLADLAPAPDRMRADGVVVRPALLHQGAARRLVHRLKYQGQPAAARLLARLMLARLPQGATALVPVPRSAARLVRYGVDPAAELAAAMAAAGGPPVVAALAAPLYRPAHAGRERDRRAPAVFRRKARVGPGAVLVDDVVTTGATLAAARRTLGGVPWAAVTATVSGV